MQSLCARLTLAFLILFMGCSSRVPIKPEKGGGDASSLATITVSLSNEAEIEEALKGERIGYHFRVGQLEGSNCAVATKEEYSGPWQDRKLSQSVVPGCDYSVGVDVGVLEEEGSKLAKVLYSSCDGIQKCWTVMSSSLVAGGVYEIKKNLPKARGTVGGGGEEDPGEGGGGATDEEEEMPAPIPKTKEVLGYYVNWQTEGSLSQDSLASYGGHLSHVGPFWYTVTTAGAVESVYGGVVEDAIKAAKAKGVRIIPLINNQGSHATMLTDAAVKQTTIDNITGLVQTQNYDGVNINFEGIAPSTKDSHTDFVKKLADKMHAMNKIVVVSVYPKVEVPEALSGAYDYMALAQSADRLEMMTHDHHYAGGTPGAIAPYPWVEANIKHALELGVPADKLLLGVATYGYDWPASGSGVSLGEKDAFKLASATGATIVWDDASQTPYFTYNKGGQNHTVYFENSYSAAFKFRLVNTYKLKGVGLWRLGTETARFWEILNVAFAP